MQLSQFRNLLQLHPEKQFHLMLPNRDAVPVSFHITEVGHVTKKFIDCGGKLHTIQTCQLQAWVWSDTDHRLLAGKMAGVLTLAESKGILPSGVDLDIEIEYEDAAISQYPVESYTITESAIVLRLAAKHTDCLAKGVCLPMAQASVNTPCGCDLSGCC